MTLDSFRGDLPLLGVRRTHAPSPDAACPMRFPVRSKLIVALLALVGFGLVVIALTYGALADVRSEVDKLARHRQPLSVAAHEIEINVNGIGMSVLAYIESARPVYREWIVKERREIEHFLQAYLQLAESPSERELGVTMRQLLEKFMSSTSTILNKSDALTAALAELGECTETVDRIIDAWVRRVEGLPPAQRAGATPVLQAVWAVEAELAEVGSALMWRHPATTQARQQKYLTKLGDFESAVLRLISLPLTPGERAEANRIVDEQRQIVGLIERTVALEGELDLLREGFIAQRVSIDRLLNEQVQKLAQAGFEVPLSAVERVSESAVRNMSLFVFPLFTLAVLILGVLIYRGVSRPMLALTKGMRMIAQGDLVHPIAGMPNDEFGDLAAEFNRMAQQLRERGDELLSKDAELRRRETMASMGSLVSGVAHEVRNPLFGITSTLDALQARLHGQPELGRHLSVLRGETSRLQKLMQDLLDYGRPVPHVRSRTDLYAVIQRALAICAPLAREAGVRVASDLAGDAPLLELDPQRIEQVFVNLIENALQHSSAGQEVSVSACHDAAFGQAGVVCTVRDQGPGFRDEDVQRIFDPFFTRRRGGTGLGLSIVQRIVEEHGGQVSASNHAEGGAVLRLRLPASSPDEPADQAPRAGARTAAAPQAAP
jgi:signal transduction histidine kinase/CHASE3 domain sensor protein